MILMNGVGVFSHSNPTYLWFPSAGNHYSVVVDIQNLNPNSTCTAVVLMDDNGKNVTEIFVTRVQLMGIARYIGDFIPYNKVHSYFLYRRETLDKTSREQIKGLPLFYFQKHFQIALNVM